ncbi:MFS transporter [Kitasatospora indigofera]|uniref:MFS transporter n=1 Tax=Kitasatospora indigofera TaxID=67307 RepID=A0A919KKR4_9ACTN|nr:MFS transporter [Kitasatospora indigofera]GHH61188.1 MFS transporter [Kitasatospora indigofera]
MSVDAVPDEVPARAAGSRARARGLTLTAIVGAEFMLQLDGTVVNVALPALQSDLGLSAAAGSWVPNAFLLAFGGLLLLAGRLGDAFGHRRVFVGGLGLVVLASLLAGLAPGVELLLAGRLLQGAGAALAGPNGLALLAVVFEGERRQRAFGLYSTVTGLGASAGMVLGGVLTWAGDWRWSLLVNVPVGLLIIVLSLTTPGLAGAGTRSRPLGLLSAALVTAAVGTAVYGLVHAAEQGWGDAGTLVPLAGSAALWVLLAVVDPRTSEPLLPAAVLAGRERAGAFVDLLLLAAVLTGFLVYLVQYLRGVLHFNALQSGLAVLPFGLALLLSTQVLTPYVSGVGLKTRALLGLGVVLAGVAWLARLDADSSYLTGVLPQIVLVGLGVGVAIVPFNMIILSAAPPEHAGVAAGVLQTALTVGGSLGLAVLLIPFTGGDGEIAGTISTVFLWAAGATVLALLVSVLLWYGPGARRAAPPERAAEA